MVQLSHAYMTIDWKNIALTRWTFVDKVMSLLFTSLPIGHSFHASLSDSFPLK